MEVQKILERHVKVRKLDFRKKLNPEKEFACTALRVVFCSRYFKEKTLKKKIKIFATWRNSYYSTRLQNIDVISRFSRHVHHFPISCVTFFKSRVCPNSFFYLVEFCPNPSVTTLVSWRGVPTPTLFWCLTNWCFVSSDCSASGTSGVAIDNKIEQAMVSTKKNLYL